MESKTTYFETPGTENTDATLALARQRAGELGIKTILVASTVGVTAVKAVEVFKGLKVVVVSHAYGVRQANTQSFTEENRKIVTDKGGVILTATHAFGGINTALQSFSPMSPAPAGQPPGGQQPGAGGPPPGGPPPRSPVIGEIVATTLGIFSRGMKVTCEIAAMAADAGLVRTDEEVIAIAGSGRGADTAIVVQPSNANRFFDTKVKEIICKPRL
jgi:hypothetical protein